MAAASTCGSGNVSVTTSSPVPSSTTGLGGAVDAVVAFGAGAAVLAMVASATIGRGLRWSSLVSRANTARAMTTAPVIAHQRAHHGRRTVALRADVGAGVGGSGGGRLRVPAGATAGAGAGAGAGGAAGGGGGGGKVTAGNVCGTTGVRNGSCRRAVNDSRQSD